MDNKVEIKFESNQEYQLNAVNSVAGLFEGRTKLDADFVFDTEDTAPNADEYDFLSDHGEELEENLFKIQRDEKNKVPENIRCRGLSAENDGETLISTIENYDSYSYPEFTVNMETGTGKTYVYLRTIYELRERYGFSKFIIIVPSVAIFEGVVSTFKATLSHFKSLYSPTTVPNSIIEYDGTVTKCKTFATSHYIQIMVMTIDSFNKSSNVIFKSTDKIMGGKLPIHYIQEARPILILDEVQNYRRGKSPAALRTLHPYFSVGYSATPGNDCPNLLYKLSSFDALQLNLVKKIEIFGTEEEYSGAGAEDFIRVNRVKTNGKNFEASVELQEKNGGALKLKSFTLHLNDKLFEKTKNSAYGEIKVENMCASEDNMYLELSDGKKYYVKTSDANTLTQQSMFRQMIRNTIQTHIEKKRTIRQCGYDAKVLSLFFIDRVASYNGSDPIVKNIFDEEFESLKHQDPDLAKLSAEDVRKAYFASKKEKNGEEKFLDSFDDMDKKSKDAAEKEAFNLIMKGKEELLSNDNSVCFIFAHSALREGWDNPNVFQICSLREIKSENARRQTIGRGLRLPVGQNGERIRDKKVNLLTVIADESYTSFVQGLQSEYEEDGTMIKQMFKNHREKQPVNRIEKNFKSPKFSTLWSKMNQKTTYTINVDTDKLIKEAISKIDSLEFTPPKILTSHAKMVITKYRITLTEVQPNGTQATIRIETADSNGKKFENNCEEFEIEKNSVLNKNHNYLSKFKVASINYDNGPEKRHNVVFKDLADHPFELGKTQEFDTTSGQHIQTDAKDEVLPDIPKCNLLERTEKEVPLTRRTILEIFKGLKESVQMEFIKNPEGFASQFVATLKEVYADHIADNIEYSDDGTPMSFKVDGKIINDDALFLEHPEISIFEMQEANQNISIYDQIQVDSEVERNFVKRLNDSEKSKGQVVLYFKFPPQYKIFMPKIIGNYNPDWAISCQSDDGMDDLYLVRETKSTENLEKLWHTSERRKIECAKKHYKAIRVRYRVVDDKDDLWYKNETGNIQTDLLAPNYPIPSVSNIAAAGATGSVKYDSKEYPIGSQNLN